MAFRAQFKTKQRTSVPIQDMQLITIRSIVFNLRYQQSDQTLVPTGFLLSQSQ